MPAIYRRPSSIAWRCWPAWQDLLRTMKAFSLQSMRIRNGTQRTRNAKVLTVMRRAIVTSDMALVPWGNVCCSLTYGVSESRIVTNSVSCPRVTGNVSRIERPSCTRRLLELFTGRCTSKGSSTGSSSFEQRRLQMFYLSKIAEADAHQAKTLRCSEIDELS